MSPQPGNHDLEKQVEKLETELTDTCREEKKYRELVENIPDALYTRDRFGRMVYVSETIESITGYSRLKWMNEGEDFWKANIHPEDVEKVEKSYRRLFGKNAGFNVEYRFRKKDGDWVWINDRAGGIREENGNIFTEGIIRDISRRKEKETELKEAKTRFDSILRTIPDIIYRLDSEGYIVFISEAVKMYGYTPHELDGKRLLELVHPEDKEKAIYRINERRTGKRSHRSFEIRLLYKKNGQSKEQGESEPDVKWPVFLVSAEGLYSMDEPEESVFQGTQGVARDITEIKMAEQEGRKLEARYQQIQRMEAIGTLASGIAHDVNNLLMGIQGNVSLMLTAFENDPKQIEKLKNIEKYVQSGAGLTKQLLNLARGGNTESRPVDLNDLVENVTHMFQRARKEIQVITSLEPELWPVECDSIQIEQVVLNLLVNAWHAMSDGGVITVETENCRRCEGALGHEEKCVKLLISDTGKGMDSETKRRIFEPFFTTRKQEAGTGLGLTTAFAIVERHGGAIEVDSEPGKGTTFEIYFPATTAVAGETEKQNPRMLSGKETILLIDDEEMIIDVGSQMIELMGYQVMTAETGKNALEVFSENRDRIDLIILDLIMPDMSGRKVFESLRELKPDIKILISSGYSMEGEVKDLLNTGGDAFLQKPFNMNMLSEKIREVLDLEGKEEYCKRG